MIDPDHHRTDDDRDSAKQAAASPKQWQPLDHQECIYCGDEAEVFTNIGELGMAWDGDAARCVDCHCPGVVIADEGCARVQWHDEPGCDCEWCKTHPTLGPVGG